jgi:hypothetical protein
MTVVIDRIYSEEIKNSVKSIISDYQVAQKLNTSEGAHNDIHSMQPLVNLSFRLLTQD